MHKILIYSTLSCPYCVMVKDFLKSHNIEFTDFNVADDEKARDEMVKKTNQMGVPVIDIDGEIIIGFDKPKISQILGIKE
ncbi:MAG: NrdH-redoxin [Parcubacteria group bacterium GW2011_GWA2_38_13b]|nr:MAG: NrdH-redoxin [Parcubacteria group bacterium GW2011_GWA2_38_13b]